MTEYENREAIENEAYRYWESFVDEITYHNRFNPHHPLPSFLKDYLRNHCVSVDAGTIYYRARVIDYGNPEDNTTGFAKFVHHEECGEFEGYDEKNSFVPPANVALLDGQTPNVSFICIQPQTLSQQLVKRGHEFSII